MEIEKFKEAYELCLLFQSRLGILQNKLAQLLQDEFETHKSVYELLHHQNQALLSCQLFRLAKKCKQETPENFETLKERVFYTKNEPKLLTDFSEKVLGLEPDLYPRYPLENHQNVLDIYDKIRGYYTNKIPKSYIELSLKVNFYGDWERLLNLSEKSSNLYWVERVLELVHLEPNKDNQVTILNIIKRNRPRIEEYLNSLE